MHVLRREIQKLLPRLLYMSLLVMCCLEIYLKHFFFLHIFRFQVGQKCSITSRTFQVVIKCVLTISELMMTLKESESVFSSVYKWKGFLKLRLTSRPFLTSFTGGKSNWPVGRIKCVELKPPQRRLWPPDYSHVRAAVLTLLKVKLLDDAGSDCLPPTMAVTVT